MAGTATHKPTRKSTRSAAIAVVALFALCFLDHKVLNQPMPIGVTAVLAAVVAFGVGRVPTPLPKDRAAPDPAVSSV